MAPATAVNFITNNEMRDENEITAWQHDHEQTAVKRDILSDITAL